MLFVSWGFRMCVLSLSLITYPKECVNFKPQSSLMTLLNSESGPRWLIGVNLQFGTCSVS